MSDLKHRSTDELRKLIYWCVKKRAEHRAEKERKTEILVQLQHEIDTHGKMDNNIGQKEAWARMWLARKEISQEGPKHDRP